MSAQRWKRVFDASARHLIVGWLAGPGCARRKTILRLVFPTGLFQRLPFGDGLFELFVGHRVIGYPCVAHVIDRPLAIADPVVGIVVSPITGTVVVPSDKVKNSPCGQE